MLGGIGQRLREALETRRQQAAIRSLETDLAPLREEISSESSAGTALIVSNSNWLYQVKLEGILGLALRRQGWRVVVLTQADRTFERAVFGCFGLKEMICSKSLKPDLPEDEIKAFLDTELAAASSFEDFKELRFRESWIGPQILSTVCRQLKATRLDLKDADLKLRLRDVAREALVGVFLAHRIYDMVQPTVLLTVEANYAFKGALVDIAVSQSLDVLHFNPLARDGAVLFKRLNQSSRRRHPNSLGPATWDKVRAEAWTPEKEAELEAEWEGRYGGSRFIQNRDQPGVEHTSENAIRERLGIKQDRKVVCVFSHVLWDTNLFYGNDLYADFSDWLWHTARLAAEVPGVDWIFKLHPANHWKSAMEGTGREEADRELVEEALDGKVPEHIHFLEPRCGISTLSLFRMLWAGITVRGTVGMELPCFGVPALTAGTGRYAGRGFTVDSGSREEYEKRLRGIADLPRPTQEQVELARKHAHAVFLRRLWRMTSFEPDFSSGYAKNGHFLWDLNLVSGPPTDLDHFARWVPMRDEEDYLSESA